MFLILWTNKVGCHEEYSHDRKNMTEWIWPNFVNMTDFMTNVILVLSYMAYLFQLSYKLFDSFCTLLYWSTDQFKLNLIEIETDKPLNLILGPPNLVEAQSNRASEAGQVSQPGQACKPMLGDLSKPIAPVYFWH